MAIIDDPRTAFPAAPYEGIGTKVGTAATQIFGFAFREWRAIRAAEALHALTDTELDDLGLLRSDIERAVRHGRR